VCVVWESVGEERKGRERERGGRQKKEREGGREKGGAREERERFLVL
jgi:hypothetical protein